MSRYKVFVNGKVVFEGERLKDCPTMKIPSRSQIQIYDYVTGEVWEMTHGCLSQAIKVILEAYYWADHGWYVMR